MTQICKVCSHPKRVDIDREILAGGKLTRIAKNYSLPYHSLYAHAQTHVSTRLARAMERKELQEGFNLMDDINVLRKRLEEMFINSEAKGHVGTSLKITSEQRAFIELLAKISYANIQNRIQELEEENARLKSGEINTEQAEEFQKRLKVFTLPELEVLEKLGKKLVTQDKSIRIIPASNNTFESISNNTHVRMGRINNRNRNLQDN